MLNPFTKAIAVCGMAALAGASAIAITATPAAAQFGSRYALEDDDVFDHRPARRHIEIDDEDEAPRVERRIIERRIVRPVVERHIIEREIVQPVVERTVVRRVVQPIVERRVVYRPPIVKKVVVHRPLRRAHYVYRPWHQRKHCFLPERHLCG